MPKQTKTCRVCGATYEACRSVKPNSDVFNWREVACSPECGSVYLQKVMASRSGGNKTVVSEPTKEVTVRRASRKKNTVEVSADVSTDVSEESNSMHMNADVVSEETAGNVDFAVEEE